MGLAGEFLSLPFINGFFSIVDMVGQSAQAFLASPFAILGIVSSSAKSYLRYKDKVISGKISLNALIIPADVLTGGAVSSITDAVGAVTSKVRDAAVDTAVDAVVDINRCAISAADPLYVVSSGLVLVGDGINLAAQIKKMVEMNNIEKIVDDQTGGFISSLGGLLGEDNSVCSQVYNLKDGKEFNEILKEYFGDSSDTP